MFTVGFAKSISHQFHRNSRWISGRFLLLHRVENRPQIPPLSNPPSFLQFLNHSVNSDNPRSFVKVPCVSASPVQGQNVFAYDGLVTRCFSARYMSNSTIELRTDEDVVRFSFNNVPEKTVPTTRKEKKWKRAKLSRKAKVNELRFYRLKAKKKINSPNPEVRIRYKLEKAKRKEEWLIEKLRKYEVPKAPMEPYDPETLTEEEQHYLKRTGEKRKNFVLVGRRGVFGGVVLNMHLHWKKHETVKIICKPCRPGQIQEYAEELARLSKGIVIDIKPNNSIVLYRGKNYVRPEVMSPLDTLSKDKALEKYKFEQSLEHTSEFIERLEKELEEYQKHVARYKKRKEEEAEKKESKSL